MLLTELACHAKTAGSQALCKALRKHIVNSRMPLCDGVRAADYKGIWRISQITGVFP